MFNLLDVCPKCRCSTGIYTMVESAERREKAARAELDVVKGESRRRFETIIALVKAWLRREEDDGGVIAKMEFEAQCGLHALALPAQPETKESEA